jgi:hypothetical protein
MWSEGHERHAAAMWQQDEGERLAARAASRSGLEHSGVMFAR